MQDDTDQAAPGGKAKREFSQTVKRINADILAAGGLHHDNPTPERLAQAKRSAED